MTGKSLLEAPEAQALLEEAMIEPADVADCRRQIEGFLSVPWRPQSAAVEVGAGAWRPPPDRGVPGRGQTGSGAGTIRGAELGGQAPSHDAVPAGPVVPDDAS